MEILLRPSARPITASSVDFQLPGSTKQQRSAVWAIRKQELCMEIVMIGVEILRRALCRSGPYLFVELVMPGGTLLALLMYLYQRHAAKKEAGTLSISPVVERL